MRNIIATLRAATFVWLFVLVFNAGEVQPWVYPAAIITGSLLAVAEITKWVRG
jgi:hypothetical protein